ncbi:MAG: glycoside hydrolase family 15 protein [Phycisphaerales bacterium]|nr:glycoside hydrolase family 15 protein [Phycisphaerales bacterium]
MALEGTQAMQESAELWMQDLAAASVLLIFCEDAAHGAAEPFGKLPHTHVFAGDRAALEAARHQTGAGSILVCSRRGLAILADGGKHIDLAGPDQTEDRLADLFARRKWWLNHRDLTPINAHSMLSDQRTIALVDPHGSIVWLCLPRIDSSAIFSSMLADPSRGIFSIKPINATHHPQQRYLDDSFILETRWGDLTLTDYLDCSGGRPFQRAGRSELIRVLQGAGQFRITFAPRLDFGRSQTRINRIDDGLEIDGWTDPVVLYAPGVNWTIEDDGKHQFASATIDTTASPAIFELRYGTRSTSPAIIPESARREQTLRFWNGWARTLTLPGLSDDLVKRSALVIKALCYGPSGGISAAGTTSLPEHLGGVRNWDYRFCWIRDACMSAASLTRIGNTGMAMKLLDWLITLVEHIDSPERLRPVYTVSGGHLPPEADITELSGYGGSKPVRIGNAASTQVQLDVFGPIVDLVHMVAQRGAPITPEHWRLVESMVNAVAARWREPDHGIWEIRAAKRQHIHTKAMCWLAVDRGLQVAEKAMGYRRPAWKELRAAIADDVTRNGVAPDRSALISAYEVPAPDAATLLAGFHGMIDPMDPLFIGTVDSVQNALRRGPVVDRYHCDDGLPGREGGWVICAYWLAESLALSGRPQEARKLFDQTSRLAGPTGLFSEEYDPDQRVTLGNFPQAYSHLGLIDAAYRLSLRSPG